MKTIIATVTLSAGIILLSGCTSIAMRTRPESRSSNGIIYPGVKQDAKLVAFPFRVVGTIFYGMYATSFAPEKDEGHVGFGLVALPFAIPVGCYGLVDMPFSALADTVLLPSDLRSPTDEEKEEEPQHQPAR